MICQGRGQPAGSSGNIFIFFVILFFYEIKKILVGRREEKKTNLESPEVFIRDNVLEGM